MYAEIHSRSEVDDDSPGKRSWVNAENFQVELLATTPEHPNKPPWHLVVKATMTEGKSPYTGRLTGESYKAIIRNLEIHLTPQDISRLLEFATANKLLSIGVKAQVGS